MDRREFLAKAGLLATWAAIPVTLTSCGDDSNPTGDSNNGSGDIDGSVSVSAGHTHSVTITKAQLDAGGAVVLTLTGGTHTHTVSLTSEQVMSIAEGGRVSKESTSVEAHTHIVTFN